MKSRSYWNTDAIAEEKKVLKYIYYLFLILIYFYFSLFFSWNWHIWCCLQNSVSFNDKNLITINKKGGKKKKNTKWEPAHQTTASQLLLVHNLLRGAFNMLIGI